MAVSVSLPVWQPECVGNGRLLLIGEVLANSDQIDAIQWKVNDSDWHDGVTSPDTPSQFSFWTYGQSPLPGTEELPEWTDEGDYWQATVYRPVVYLTRSDVLVSQVDYADVATTDGSWSQSGDTVRYRPSDGSAPGEDVVAVIAPGYEEGRTYTLTVRAESSGSYTTLATETFEWTLTTRDVPGHMMDVVAPSYVGQMQVARDFMYAQGMMIADMYAVFDDYLQQSYPETATWSLSAWESFLGIPTITTLSTTSRRAAVVEIVRGGQGLRGSFFPAVEAAIGVNGSSVTDTYSNYRVDVRLPLSGSAAGSADVRASAESVISRLKPAGIEVIVAYASFIAGESEAGDPI